MPDDLDRFLDAPQQGARDELDDFLDGPGAQAGPQVSLLESAGRGAVQGATLGSSDEIVGAGGGILEAGRQYLSAGGFPSLLGDADPRGPSRGVTRAYQDTRDTEREANLIAQQSNPRTYLAGEIAGGIAGSAVVPQSALAKGASLGKRVLTGAKAGAATGAAAGAGYSGADLLEGEFGEFAKDTAVGGTTGGVLGGAVPAGAAAVRGTAGAARRGAQAVADRTPEKLREFAGGQFFKAFGGQGRNMIRQIGDADDVRELGNWALDSGLITAGASRDTIGQRAAALNRSAGETIGALRDQAQQLGYGPKSSWIRGQLERMVSKYRKFEGLREADQLSGIVDDFKEQLARNTDDAGRVPPDVLDDLKDLLDDRLFSSASGFTDSFGKPRKEALALRSQIRRLFKEAEERVVDQLGEGFEVEGQPALEAFRRAKQDYGNTLDVLRTLEYAEQGELARLGLGIRETGLVLAGTVEPTGAALVGGAKRLSDRYGNSLAGVGARKLGEGIERASSSIPDLPALPEVASRILEDAARKGPQAVAAAAVILSQQYPEQRREILESADLLRASPRRTPAPSVLRR